MVQTTAADEDAHVLNHSSLLLTVIVKGLLTRERGGQTSIQVAPLLSSKQAPKGRSSPTCAAEDHSVSASSA
jgi:hypothetical protein